MVPYFQIIEYINEDGSRIISGLVTSYMLTSWVEGINNRTFIFYEYELVFEEKNVRTVQLTIRTRADLGIRANTLNTFFYRQVKEGGEPIYVLTHHIASKIRCFKTPLSVKEPKFFHKGRR